MYYVLFLQKQICLKLYPWYKKIKFNCNRPPKQWRIHFVYIGQLGYIFILYLICDQRNTWLGIWRSDVFSCIYDTVNAYNFLSLVYLSTNHQLHKYVRSFPDMNFMSFWNPQRSSYECISLCTNFDFKKIIIQP